MEKKRYLTTAIDYANGSPHLGHAYEKVLADVVARSRRLMGEDVHFLTGLDEHGQKVQMSAHEQGLEPSEICDRMAEEFQGLCRDLEISYDDYIRTTEPRHETVVRNLLQQLYDKGEIYKAEYSGFYSVRQEQFVTEKEKVDGVWPAIYGEVIEVTESNYFFKLAKYQDWLIDFLKANEDFIYPGFRASDALNFLAEPLNDLCISRPKERLSWGIELPFDSDYVTYVWFDALVNYISAVDCGSESFDAYWPADIHVIGKDILVPPHAVYWPIMLKALGLPQPKCLLVHGWWLSSGSKMSKSAGSGVDPLDLIGRFGPDAFRYFVTREMNVGQDSEFSVELFLSRYNNDLGNDLGNLVARLLHMGARYCEGRVPAASVDGTPEQEMRAFWERTREETLRFYEGFQFHKGLDRAFAFIAGINRYAEERAPWKLAKSSGPDDRAKLETSLAVIAEGLRLAVTLLSPVMPGTAKRVYELVGETPSALWENQLRWGDRLEGRALGEKTILFPRADAQSVLS